MNTFASAESSAGRCCAMAPDKVRAGSNAVTHHAVAALTSATRTKAILRVMPIAYSTADVQVDIGAGVIRNAAVMTVGPAKGHGFEIDATTLQQVATLINANSAGVKCRLRHPKPEGEGQSEDDITILIGRVCNARIDGDSVRGDVYLEDYASIVPGMGDVRAYLLSIANCNPTHIGLSAVIEFEVDPQTDAAGNPVSLPARVFDVQAVDFTGNPAANNAGLLTTRTGKRPLRKTTSLRTTKMDYEKLKTLLRGLGLAEGATDEQADSFLADLEEDQRTDVLTKLNAGGEDKEGLSGGDDDEEKASSLAAKAKKKKQVLSAGVASLRTVNEDDQFIAAERARITNLRSLGKVIGVDDDAINEAIKTDLSVKAARTHFLAAMSKKTQPIHGVRVGDNQQHNMMKLALPAAVMLRAGKTVDVVRKVALANATQDVDGILSEAQKLSVHSLTEMYRRHLMAHGVTDALELSRVRLAELMGPRALRNAYGLRVASLAESSSDFPALLLDAMNKTLRAGYIDAPRTWQKWAKRATAPDFKNINRVVLSDAPNLVSRNEGGEIKYVRLTDSKETYVLNEFIQGISLTRRAIINDDLNAFAVIPQQQALAAGRCEEDVAYAVLTGNALMADGYALFSNEHSNYTSSGTAIGRESLSVANTMMKKQKGPNGARLELEPKFLVVPTSIEEHAKAFVASQYLMPSMSSATAPSLAQAPANIHYNRFEVIGSTRLDDDDTNAWYTLADYRTGQVDTIEVCFLQDEPEPVARQETDFDTEDVRFAIRHTVAAKSMDHRGVYMNEGA